MMFPEDRRRQVQLYLLARCNKTDSCWEWTGPLNEHGYGRTGMTCTLPLRPYAHRLSYELYVGEIPEGLVLDHLCRNPRCIRPDHLEVVTRGENCMRGISPVVAQANKTHCIRGHEFNEENTYITRKGRRKCRRCANIYDDVRRGKAPTP